jgi:Flp pilus assembly protein TadG
MVRFPSNPRQAKQKGQTLVLVAISLTALISLAALAIDLTSLYTARGEMQRAADAAALAAAKAFVESGVTTAPQNTNLQSLAQTIGNAYINSTVQMDKIGGVVPTVVGGAGTYTFSQLGDPQVTVTLQRTDVPTFFAHIFGQRLETVTASATAEAYNSSEPPGESLTNMPPVSPSCVKPWLIPNSDPRHGNAPFVNETTGALTNPDIYPTGIIGEEIVLNNGCGPTGICVAGLLTPTIATAPNMLPYLPAQLAAAASVCPSCEGGGNNFTAGSACCDTVNS